GRGAWKGILLMPSERERLFGSQISPRGWRTWSSPKQWLGAHAWERPWNCRWRSLVRPNQWACSFPFLFVLVASKSAVRRTLKVFFTKRVLIRKRLAGEKETEQLRCFGGRESRPSVQQPHLRSS